MAAGTYNLTIEQGVDLALQIAVKDASGTTYSLAGSSVSAQIRDDYNGNLLANFSAVTNTGTTGTLALTLSAVTAANLPLSGGKWDLLLTTSAGTKIRLLAGNVTVSGEVTK